MVLEPSSSNFSEEVLVMVINFLTRFMSEANIQAMSKVRALIALRSFHKRFSKSHYKAEVESVFSEEGEAPS